MLRDVTLVVAPGARIGLVGPNGIGKTTLLRILAGLEPPDTGAVRRSPPSLAVGYLPQEPDARPGETLLDYLARRTQVAPAEARLDELTRELEHDGSLVGAYSDALERFLALGGADLEARAAAVCGDLGLRTDRLSLPLGVLSGGEAARAALAAILLARLDVFLLDEPTNDLDFDGLDRLERFVGELRGAAVVVSHDRDFVDRTVTRVVEIDEGSRRAVEYAGGWSEYERARALAFRQRYEAYEATEAERRRLEEELRRRREWVVRAGRTGQRRKKKTRDIQKRYRTRIDRLDAAEKPFEPWELRLRLEADRRSGDVVARLDGAVVERGAFTLGPIDLEVAWRDRLAIVGANGSGKTTLLQAVLGRVPLARGTRHVGAGVVLGELDQRRSGLGEGPLLDVFVTASGLSSEDARTLLAKFGLGADDVVRTVVSLSPGERTRATLALLVARGVNCLVLDEPTNHLDVAAIEELEAAIEGFDGTVLLVTHDRRFLERFRATRTLAVPPSRAPAAPAGPGRAGGRPRPRDRASSS